MRFVRLALHIGAVLTLAPLSSAAEGDPLPAPDPSLRPVETRKFEWVQEGKKWIKRYEDAPPLAKNSTLLEPERHVVLHQFRVKE